MKNYNKAVADAIRAIETLANIIQNNPNVEEYVRESIALCNEEINDALNDSDFKYAALLVAQDELFNA